MLAVLVSATAATRGTLALPIQVTAARIVAGSKTELAEARVVLVRPKARNGLE
jgi:hypothetical protein